jgi:hypothetical protein
VRTIDVVNLLIALPFFGFILIWSGAPNGQPATPGATMSEKLLELHQTLIYPAFLGTLLVNFTGDIIGLGLWTFITTKPLESILGLWFVSYFVIAHMLLIRANRRAFGWVSFLANLMEVIVILIAALAFTGKDHPDDKSIDFWQVAVCWLAIPVTAVLSNWYSDRNVKTMLSAVVFIAALIVTIYWWSHKPSPTAEWLFMGLMIVMLFLYLMTLVSNRPMLGDRVFENGSWKWSTGG